MLPLQAAICLLIFCLLRQSANNVYEKSKRSASNEDRPVDIVVLRGQRDYEPEAKRDTMYSEDRKEVK